MSSHAEVQHDEHPVTPLALYIRVYVILMVLLMATVWAAYMHLGAWALPIALTIALIKAGYVVTYFMHMRFTGRLMQIYASVAIVWLLMMIMSIMMDVYMRNH